MAKNLTYNHFETAGIYVEGQRSQFHFKKPVYSSFCAGMLNPLGDPIPVFPGTKLDLSINAVIRSNTMVVPPLNPLFIDFFAVWVPHRIVWNHMPQFLGEPETTAWTQNTQYTYPSVTYRTLNSTWALKYESVDQQDVTAGNFSLIDHYKLLFDIVDELPNIPIMDKNISVLAMRGYYSIWNYLFRDENYQRPVLFSKGDVGSEGEFGYYMKNYKIASDDDIESFIGAEAGESLSAAQAMLMPVNKLHDAFSSFLPEPQFGDAVNLIDADDALVMAGGSDVRHPMGNSIWLGAAADTPLSGNLQASSGIVNAAAGSPTAGAYAAASNLYVDVSTTVNQFRTTIMTQRYLEALGRGGRRSKEIYYSIYGVKNTDAAADYPQLQTRSRYMLGVNQVVATADSSGDGWTSHLGDTGAYSLTSLRGIPCCEKDFSEFGYLHILYCVRAENIYSQMIPPHFLRADILDEYNPYFDHSGDVDVKNYIVNSHANVEGNFGYQEAWWDERTQLAIATGALNKKYGSLGYWLTGEKYSGNITTCTPSYLVFDPATLNDIFVSSYEQYPQFIIDAVIYGKKIARMSQHSIPGIVGRI